MAQSFVPEFLHQPSMEQDDFPEDNIVPRRPLDHPRESLKTELKWSSPDVSFFDDLSAACADSEQDFSGEAAPSGGFWRAGPPEEESDSSETAERSAPEETPFKFKPSHLELFGTTSDTLCNDPVVNLKNEIWSNKDQLNRMQADIDLKVLNLRLQLGAEIQDKIDRQFCNRVCNHALAFFQANRNLLSHVAGVGIGLVAGWVAFY